MRFSTVAMALSALFVSTRADNPVVAPDVQSSVLLVLAHAIPSQSVSYAIASPAAFASEMASCLSASSTPAWYQALPTDVQSLLPQIYPQEVVSTPTPTPTPTPSSSKATPYPTAMNSTVAQPTLSATGSVSLTLSPSGTPANPSSPAFTGAAPKLSISAGLGAVIGLVGVLAL
ncbi:uncharacterized protein yc1106_01653 [Curvularia clavata]|uniref:Uncharacterized protein n=1 Tax=Curvularia clavata TaxID=95742 RepID=A0A9Q9DQ77_CURCL|nr:uncharacterized protein yc1106_01653 [Curvularia clavata]